MIIKNEAGGRDNKRAGLLKTPEPESFIPPSSSAASSTQLKDSKHPRKQVTQKQGGSRDGPSAQRLNGNYQRQNSYDNVPSAGHISPVVSSTTAAERFHAALHRPRGRNHPPLPPPVNPMMHHIFGANPQIGVVSGPRLSSIRPPGAMRGFGPRSYRPMGPGFQMAPRRATPGPNDSARVVSSTPDVGNARIPVPPTTAASQGDVPGASGTGQGDIGNGQQAGRRGNYQQNFGGSRNNSHQQPHPVDMGNRGSSNRGRRGRRTVQDHGRGQTRDSTPGAHIDSNSTLNNQS